LEEKHAIETAAVKWQQETLDIDIGLVKQQSVVAEIEVQVDESDSNDC
jgi:7,8-dihydro-6-hydroxymethylpterin-pyrophosphokinase